MSNYSNVVICAQADRLQSSRVQSPHLHQSATVLEDSLNSKHQASIVTDTTSCHLPVLACLVAIARCIARMHQHMRIPLQVPGPSPYAMYTQDLFRLLVFYWSIVADALLLKVTHTTDTQMSDHNSRQQQQHACIVLWHIFNDAYMPCSLGYFA